MTWQPIETAPQDGKTKVILGSWSADRTENTVTIATLEPTWSKQGDSTRPRSIFGFAIFYPTHWIPLPSPPETVEAS